MTLIKQVQIYVEKESASYGYIDAFVYIETDQGEWKFLIYKDMDTKAICQADPQYAEDINACFEDAPDDPPEKVADALAAKMGEILVKIGAAQAEWELR